VPSSKERWEDPLPDRQGRFFFTVGLSASCNTLISSWDLGLFFVAPGGKRCGIFSMNKLADAWEWVKS